MIRVMLAITLCTGMLWAAAAPSQSEALRRIESKFVAPCCYQDNLATHNSGAAEEMRAEIAKMVADGKTEAGIIDYYVARHGERILREPRGPKSTVLVVVPALVLLAGGAWLARYVARARRRSPPGGQPATVPSVPDDDLDW